MGGSGKRGWGGGDLVGGVGTWTLNPQCSGRGRGGKGRMAAMGGSGGGGGGNVDPNPSTVGAGHVGHI